MKNTLILFFKGLSNVIIWPLQKMDPAWRNPKIPQEHRYSVAMLCIIYFWQLFLSRFIDSSLFNFDDAKNKYDLNFYQFGGTIIGAIYFAIRLIFLRHKKNTKSVQTILIWSNAFLATAYIIYIISFNIQGCEGHLWWIKFLIGAFNSVFIGLAITWICESLFRNLRTTSAIYLGVWGFLGAMFAAIFEKAKENENVFLNFNNLDYKSRLIEVFQVNNVNWIYFLLPCILLILISVFIYCHKGLKLLEDAKLVEVYYKETSNFWATVHDAFNNIYKQKDWTHRLDEVSNLFIIKERRLILFSLLIGMTVQYWVFIASHSLEFFHHGKGSALRYVGMCIGSICILLIYNNWTAKFRRRDLLLMGFLFASFMLNIILINCSSFLQDFPKIRDCTFILIGILSCIWVICILHVGEQFDIKYRPWMIILAPNAFRASEMILQWRTHNKIVLSKEDIEKIKSSVEYIKSVNNSLGELIYDVIKSFYTNELANGVLLWGVIFSFLGVAATLVLKKDNYEGDALETDVDEEGKIDEAKILREINLLDKTSDIDFFELVNQKISEHLYKNVFKLQGYLISTYFKSNNKIRHSEYKENNKAALCNIFDENYPRKDAHRISAELISDGFHESFIEKLFNDAQYSGGLMYLSGRKNRRLKSGGFKEFKLLAINLDEIEFKNNKIPVIDYAHKSEFKNIEIKSCGKLEGSDKLIQTFALFRIDAEMYAPETYFLYIVKPISNPRCTLVIKTAIELNETNLRRLRVLISAVQARWDEIEAGEEFKRLRELQRNSLNAHFISHMVRNLSDYSHKQQNSDKRSDVTERIVKLFSSYMNIYKPYISLQEEKEMLELYIKVYIMTKRSTAKTEQFKKQIDTYLNDPKIPFGWELNVDQNFNMENIKMPRGILQPIVQNAIEKSGFDKIEEFEKIFLKIHIYKEKDEQIRLEIRNKLAKIDSVSINDIKLRINGERRKSESKASSLFFINKSIKSHNKNIIDEGLFVSLNEATKEIVFTISLIIKNDDIIEIENENNKIMSDRKVGLASKSTLIIDDLESDINKIVKCIEANDNLFTELDINEKALSFEEANAILKKCSFDIIIADLSLGNNPNDRNKWSIEIFKSHAEKIVESNTGIIIISSAYDSLKEVDHIMKKLFPKNYLGYVEKFQGVADEINACLNKYYLHFEK